MIRTVAGKRNQKIAARAPLAEAAKLTRADYAATTVKGATAQADVAAAITASRAATTAKRKATKAGAALTADGRLDLDVVIIRPHQVSVAMQTPYAAELLRQLREAKKPRRGQCSQISLDCPVEVVMDAATLESLVDKLEGELGGGT